MKTNIQKICTVGLLLFMLVIAPIQASPPTQKTTTLNTGSQEATAASVQGDMTGTISQNLNGQSNPAYNNTVDFQNFILPPWGGGMVHCTPQLTDNIQLPVPTSDIKKIWYRHSWGGERRGTWGNGIAGNGRIAACPFTNYLGIDNLILYDYDGNQLWSSGTLLNESGLNCLATVSTPMVDIYDRVVACDNWKILLVNASNRNNVHVEWISEIPHNPLHPVRPIPFSPTIVENRTIILPTKGGPLLAYDVRTGEKIAEITLGQGETPEIYYGIPEMPASDFELIISDPLSCPYHYDSQNQVIEWVASVPFGLMPPKHIFYEGNIGFFTDPSGIVYAYDNTTGEQLASNAIGTLQPLEGDDYYSTSNSACVKGNRVFVVCEKKGNTTGRLYAVDVYPNAVPSERLKVAWSFNYTGKSQASPIIIGDTIYFDGYNHSFFSLKPKDPHIYAVYLENGTKKWSVKHPFMTWFSFTADPRGGFWYLESGIFGETGENATRFHEVNGSIMERINISEVLKHEMLEGGVRIIPSSCMTICGTDSEYVMLLSANHRKFLPGKWVIALDLTDSNNLLWTVPIISLFNLNYANGQYTILMDDDIPRVLFETWTGGVYALGCSGDDQGNVPSQHQQSRQGDFPYI